MILKKIKKLKIGNKSVIDVVKIFISLFNISGNALVGINPPDEIAVSIIAEMLMIKEGGTGLPMTMPENVWSKVTSKINNSLSKSKI